MVRYVLSGSMAAMTDQPNILIILADDLGYGDVSCLNPQSRITTPHMDACAAAGCIATDAHSNSAVCTPTRYGLLTGRYAFRSWLKKFVTHGYSTPLLEDGRATIASMLQGVGYRTSCIGKWHLGLEWGLHPGATIDAQRHHVDPAAVDYAQPLRRGPHTVGFDHSLIIPASLDMAPYCWIENGRVVEEPTAWTQASERPAFWREGPSAPGFRHDQALLACTRAAETFIADQAGREPQRPFFCYLPLPSPHTPHVPRAPFQGSTDLGPYGDFVVEHDWSIGQILAALDRHGLSRNTLVVITSDNGAHSGPLGLEAHGHYCNHHFRGQKSDAWDGGHRVPFIARWPGRIPAGSRCSQTICLTDCFATCARVAGASYDHEAGEDSYNVLPLLCGHTGQPIREATVHHSIDGSFAIRRGPWKLVCCPGSGGWSAPSHEQPVEAPQRQLYHMDDDHGETVNRAEEHPQIVAELETLLTHYRSSGRSVPAGAAA